MNKSKVKIVEIIGDTTILSLLSDSEIFNISNGKTSFTRSIPWI